MRRTLLWLLVLGAVGGSAYAYFGLRETKPKFTVTTAAISRGDVVDTVGATGTLQAVTTVQVGTQVSGTIQHLYADFNSLVRRGQVLARLDPSLFATQIEQARANLIRAQADLERLRVSLDDARTKLARARELSQRQLIPKTELESTEVNVRAAEAQIRSSEAQVTQAQASLRQNEVNLEHTVIQAPIDGLVISRSVDVGQTVAASMQAPTLFVLAADLTKMQVIANLDESDVGRIRPGQAVSFRVDAYAADTFNGTVSQVRLEPKVQQNVVTYATVIDVPNNELKLKPGMTANVNIEIAKSANVLRVPNAGLRFRPTNEIYAALGQTPPVPGQGHGSDATATGPNGGDPARGRGQSASTSPPAVTNGENGDNGNGYTRGRGGERGGERVGGRMQNLSPEERRLMLERMRARGLDPSAAGGGGRGQGRGRGVAPTAPQIARANGATTIDALFGPLPRVESAGRVWLYADNQLTPIRVRIGISDGQNTELIEGELQEGTEVVTNVNTGTETRPAMQNFGPFGQPGRGGPGGFPGGVGFGGGGNRGGGGGR